jgi:two-component system response regulator AdeR
MTQRSLVLIVEDEPEIAEVLSAYLQRDLFQTVVAGDGATALQHHATLSPDLVLLDVAIPKTDGFEVLAQIRRMGQTPVIMLTARTDAVDRLSGLRMGADDYIVKPFNANEVVARVKAVLRRSTGDPAPSVIRFGGIEVDVSAYCVHVVRDEERRLVPLTLSEYRIVAHLIRRPTQVFDRSAILEACLPENDALLRTVDTHVANIRRKFEVAGEAGLLSAVRGVGYRFSAT